MNLRRLPIHGPTTYFKACKPLIQSHCKFEPGVSGTLGSCMCHKFLVGMSCRDIKTLDLGVLQGEIGLRQSMSLAQHRRLAMLEKRLQSMLEEYNALVEKIR